ncbi:energy transducer TonB [Neoroseomonas lacus]|uniref:Protein TonB n=1 Tax=Neoroseomonas lacus TaxID=287609 RepID=A0A917NMN7_9PROT|nr:energy transducer TonB [Neoroseomonas lacus]GGJ11634.1 hypothetical protein GCM10011320_18480 [Neoroseomonas lacus]
MLDRPRAAPAGTRGASTPPLSAPPRAPAASAWRWAGRVLLLALVGSGLIHAALIAALLFWPVREPVEDAGQVGTVALVFADTAAQAGGSAAEQAPPPTPPAPPTAPQPPAPPAQPQLAAPPPPAPPSQPQAAPPVPAQPQAAAPPAAPTAPAAPEAPRDIAALAPDPAGDVPVPPPPAEPTPEAVSPAPRPAEPVPEPAAPAPVPPPPQPEPPVQDAAAPPSEPAPPEARQAEAEPMPLPPPPPPQQAAAQPSQPTPPRRQAPTPADQGTMRLDAGAGTLPEPSMGSFALGAVVPPSTDPGFRNNPPDYPEAARRRGEEGVVRLNLRVAPDGRVVAAEVTTSSGYAALDRAAIEAARGWRFRPAMRAGVPVAATLTTALHFRLSEAGRR